jgi:hypothetical protein
MYLNKKGFSYMYVKGEKKNMKTKNESEKKKTK